MEATTQQTYTPVQGARWMAKNGLRITPLIGKAPFLPSWQESATTDVVQINKWLEQRPDVNFGCVAKRGEFWMLDEDIAGVVDRFTAETGITIDTLRVQSSDGRFHWYFEASGESDELLKNITQAQFKDGAASVRVDNEQCVCPFSVHPEKKTVYTPVDIKAFINPAPVEFIKWILEQQVKSQPTKSTTQDEGPILDGTRDDVLCAIAGKWRQAGLEYEEIYSALSRVNQTRCVPPKDDADIQRIVKSVCRYEKGYAGPTTLIGGKLPGEGVAQQTQPQPVTQELVVDSSGGYDQPTFPYQVMEGTTLYNGLVKPVVDNSSKHAEFVFMPAVQMMLNYLSGKVRIEMQDVNLNLYIGLVSPPGKFFKSSSCTLSHDYFKSMELSVKHKVGLSNSEGRVVVMQTGSSEGFGLALSKINSNHAILFNDELGKLVAKAGIENASLPHDLLTWYESGDFGNTVKNPKDSFSFDAGSYCFGWQWCTTTRGFNRHWPRVAGVVSGMEDRMFFVVSPNQPKPAGSYYVPPMEGAAKYTRDAIDTAVLKGVYKFESFDEVRALVAGMNPRSMQMLFALALYFAVDLGEDLITSECLTRAKALVDYREQAIKFLAPIEADNEQGRLQQEMIRELRQNKGKMTYREFCQNLNSARVGSDRWKASYRGLIGERIIADCTETTDSGRKTHVVVLLAPED